jgi:hypothetical protein
MEEAERELKRKIGGVAQTAAKFLSRRFSQTVLKEEKFYLNGVAFAFFIISLVVTVFAETPIVQQILIWTAPEPSEKLAVDSWSLDEVPCHSSGYRAL